MRIMTCAAGLLLAAAAADAQTPELTVYGPDYFASQWGPGPIIEERFEARCGCDLNFVTGDLLPRLSLEGDRTRADVVIGLNTDEIERARATGLFAPHGQDNDALNLPIEWQDDTFLPFNWSWVAFVYDANRVENPPESFAALLDAPEDLKIAIEDPRSSPAGLALLLWVKALYGDAAESVWERLAPRILTVTKGWSEAYGLFTSGEVPMVLSFNTSPAYHIATEDDHTKKAAIFDEGHYPYFELVARTSTTDQPELAEDFLAFVLSDDFQSMIAEANWSYPSALPRAEWPEVFRDLPAPDKTVWFDEEEAAVLRDEALEEWRRALSR